MRDWGEMTGNRMCAKHINAKPAPGTMCDEMHNQGIQVAEQADGGKRRLGLRRGALYAAAAPDNDNFEERPP
ncbi:MAG: hypothetical protein ABW202_13965 [Duganella sp.]